MASDSQRERIRKAYYETFIKSAWGPTVLADLEGECFARRSTYTSDNALDMAFNEGKRWLWIRILNICKISQQEIDSVTDQAKLLMED